jgi:hypothetical protein
LADNVDITQGAGTAIAADEIGGIKHQRVKISVGADGVASDAQPADADAKSSAGLLSAGLMAIGNSAVWNRVRDTTGVNDSDTGTGVLAVSTVTYNGVTYDHQRGNTQGTLLASAARTAIAFSSSQTNYNARGVVMVLVISAAGTGTLAVYLRTTSGWNLCSWTGLTQNSTLVSYPGAAVGDPQGSATIKSMPLPRTWDVAVDKSDASSWTYSLEYQLIV